MPHPSRREWRHFYLILCLASTGSASARGPALTTIGDTVFRANGMTAAGTLLISWPPFTTADNHTVATGNLSVKLAAGDSFLAQLAPNAGATLQARSTRLLINSMMRR